MNNNLEMIESIKDDVAQITANYPHYDSNLLLNILEGDIEWLTNYVQKVEDFIKLTERPEAEASELGYISGYFDAVRDLKRMVNE